MTIPRPKTLFGKTLLTIAVVSIGFQLFTLAVIGHWMLLPVGYRSADDLAALVRTVTAQWQDKAAGEKREYARRIEADYGIRLVQGEPPERDYSMSWLPYVRFVENALRDRFGEPVRLRRVEHLSGDWFWTTLTVGGERVHLGFPRSRIGVRPPLVFTLLLTVGVGATLVTAILLVRRLTTPLERLSAATARLGRGEWPDPLPEEGAEELAALARSFNRMNRQVRQLLANRTTLLAGISHDLRTPLTRIRLAVVMLEKNADAGLVSGIERDLSEMDALIGAFLELGRDLEQGPAETIDVTLLLDRVVNDARRGGALVRWNPQQECPRVLHAMALRRICANLIDNAVRYGRGRAEVVQHCIPRGGLRIDVRDRGPGIDEEHREAVFRPFFRVERSRSAETGGSGLGLAIAEQLAEANGWRIRLLPRKGGGTIARLDVPPD